MKAVPGVLLVLRCFVEHRIYVAAAFFVTHPGMLFCTNVYASMPLHYSTFLCFHYIDPIYYSIYKLDSSMSMQINYVQQANYVHNNSDRTTFRIYYNVFTIDLMYMYIYDGY
jgi:hypothetical protein